MHRHLLPIGLGLAVLSCAGCGSAPRAERHGAQVPFATLEAEGPEATTSGRVVVMSTPTEYAPESEASGYGFVQLDRVGEQVEFHAAAAADRIVVRHCIPDAADGGGIDATIGLYVNGDRRGSLRLSSRRTWLYGDGKPYGNGQSQSPTPYPHVYWDETAAEIPGGVRAGDRVRLQKDAGDEAAFYRIDLVELESAGAPLPAPVGAVSASEFGADGGDAASDTAALSAAVAAAKERGAVLYLPPGRYLLDAGLKLDGVRVQGAGMWHTRIDYTVVPERWTGIFHLAGSGAGVSDLAIDGPCTSRKGMLHAFTGAAKDWAVRRVWISHTNTAFWVGGEDGLVQGCRVRFTYADGININNGKTHAARRIVVEDNHVRGTGDDGIAILCHEAEKNQRPEDRETRDIIVRRNTVAMPWWASCIDLAGGQGHVIEDNLCSGTGLIVNLPGAYPMQPQGPAVIRRNRIIGGGTSYRDQRRGALWIYAGSTAIDGLLIEGNLIERPLFKGIDIQGGHPQRITFRGNRIVAPGEDAIVIGPQARGEGRFEGTIIEGLPAGRQPILNRSKDYAVVDAAALPRP